MQVVGRGHEHGVRLEDLARHQVGVKAIVGAQQGQVEILHRGLGHGLDLKVDADARIALAETREDGGQHISGQHGRRMDAQHPRKLARVRGGHGIGFFDVLEDVADPVEIGLARVGERDAPGRTLQQARAQMVLKVGHQPGHHRR